MAAIYEGAARSEAAKIGGVTLQIVRDWILRFNAEGPDGLVDRKPPGAAAKLGEIDKQLAALSGDARADRARAHVRDQLKALKLASIEAL